MSAASGSLVRRLVAYQALDEFMPIFPVYALLFAENGLSTAQISSLLVLWSVVTLAFEVPSGAWADTVPRRLLLCLSSVAYGAAFATWVLVPTFSGFATGFVLWGLSSALSSGTFQALAYDELVAVGARHQYARVIGIGTSAALAAMALATLLATPLVAVGGYVLAGWVSVAVCAAQFVVARSLPATPPTVSAQDVDQAGDSEICSLPELGSGRAAVRLRAAGFLPRYLQALRTGTREAIRSRVVRGGVLASAVLMGLLAFDEYFGLMLGEQGVGPVAVPLLLTAVSLGQAIGGLLADRAARWSNAVIGWIVAAAGSCIAAGVLSAHPAGIVMVALGYGALQLTIIVADARLQDGIALGARATVTSVAGLLSELVAVTVYAGFAGGAAAMSISVMVAILAGLVVLLGPAVARWLPPADVEAAPAIAGPSIEAHHPPTWSDVSSTRPPRL